MTTSSHPLQTRWIIVNLIILGLFIFLRVYRLPSTLLFFGDMGRDFLELQEWEQTKLPPLLGPQTSALPFNQSAWYFYLLMPFYLLTGRSLYATVIAGLVIHVFVFTGLIYLYRRDQFTQKILAIVIFLFAIQPQYIIQHRYLWNPSFVGLFLLVAFLSFRKLSLRFSWRVMFVFTLSLALAVSFSYSALPAVLSLLLLGLLTIKPKLKLISAFIGSLLLVNFPTLVFELRHHFLLTRMMLYGDKLTQSGADPLTKIKHLYQYLLLPNQNLSPIILSIFFLAYVYVGIRITRGIASVGQRRVFSALSLTTFLTIFAPFSLHSHYIFGILTLAVIFVAYLPPSIRLILILLLSILYLQPKQLHTNFQPAIRSVNQTLSCTESFCAQSRQPLFVSVQAGYHPYHDAKDFRYLLARSGCQVKDIVTQPTAADFMAVVSDNSVFTPGQTAYHELTLLGPATQSAVFTCQDNLKIHVLSRL